MYPSFTLDARQLWDLERQSKLSADMLTHIPKVVFGMKFIQQVQDSFLSQQSKCTEKLVISMHDPGWNTQFTEVDIVEEDDVPLLMSLPQMPWISI